jgi:hypothetical protein
MSNTGEPAFPTATLAQKTEGGMTLRDYFAAKAMQGAISTSLNEDHVNCDMCAIWSYEMADAMLKEREK